MKIVIISPGFCGVLFDIVGELIVIPGHARQTMRIIGLAFLNDGERRGR